MTNLNQTAADKALAANADLNVARHRIAALETSKATRAANVQRARIKLARLTGIEAEPGEQEKLSAFIAEQQTAIDAEEAECKALEGSLQSLILKVGSLGMAATNAARDANNIELNEAITQWLAVTTAEPVVSAAERVRKAFAAVGKKCPLQLDPAYAARAL